MPKIKVLRGNTSSLANYAGQSGEIALNYETGNLVFWTNTANVYYTLAGVAAGVVFDWSVTPTETKVVASDAEAGDRLGSQVSISDEGDYAIAGAWNENGGYGAAYIFTRSGSTWTQQAKIVSSDLQSGDAFGGDVSINGDGTYAAVGARREDTGGSNTGSVYIFTRSGSTWTQQAKIQASDLQASDEFGGEITINGDGTSIIVGAAGEDGGAGDPIDRAGAAYVFTRSGSTWTQQAKLTASDAQATDRFGGSVAINPDATYAIVGAYEEDTGAYNSGAAYIFTRSGSTWTQQAKIVASDDDAYDQFGYSVEINSDGDYAIIGAYADSGEASGAGAAYIFLRTGSSWTQQAKLTASDAQASDFFGGSVAINGDATYAIVGANNEDGGAGDPATDAGAAYIFSRSGSTWTELAKLTASDAQGNDYFGDGVAISNNGAYIIVGATNEAGGAGDPANYAGAAYIFDAT